MAEGLEQNIRRTSSSVDQLWSRVEGLEKNINDCALQITDVVLLQQQFADDRERQWQEAQAQVETIEQAIQEMAHLEAIRALVEEMELKDQAFEMQLDKLLEHIESKEQFPKNPVSTNIMATFLVPRYEELVHNCLDWKSPSFYTHHQGYKIYLGVRGHKIETDLLLLSLYAEPGEYDERLNWPALYNFQVEIVNKRGGENMKFCTGWNCWSRPRHNMESLLFKKVGYFGQAYVMVENNCLVDYVDDDSLEIKVAESPMTEAEQQAKLRQSGRSLDCENVLSEENLKAGVSSNTQPELKISDLSLEENTPPEEGSIIVSNDAQTKLELELEQSNHILPNDEKPLPEENLQPKVSSSKTPELRHKDDSFKVQSSGDNSIVGSSEVLEDKTFLRATSSQGDQASQSEQSRSFDEDSVLMKTMWLPRYSKFIETCDGSMETFYTHKRGYKMELEVEALKMPQPDNSTVLQLTLRADSGRCDRELKWPARFDFQLEIVNKRGGSNMIFRTGVSHWDMPVCPVKLLFTSRTKQEPGVTIDTNMLDDFVDFEDTMEIQVKGTSKDDFDVEVPRNTAKGTPASSEQMSMTKITKLCLSPYSEFLRTCANSKGKFYARGYLMELGLKVLELPQLSQNKFLLLSVSALIGEYDEQVKWPAEFNFQLEIVNQVGGKNMTFSTGPNRWNRPITCPARLHFSMGNLNEIGLLINSGKLGSYVEKDLMEIRVSEIKAVPERQKLSSESPGGGSSKKDPVVFTDGSSVKCVMPNYSKIAASKQKWRSPPFYSHHCGYKLCLSVCGHLNYAGVEHLVLVISRLCGEFDDTLDWPVWYNVRLEIVDKLGGRDFHLCTGFNQWKRSYKDMVPLLFMKQSRYFAFVECGKIVNFVENDKLEFSLHFERSNERNLSDFQKSLNVPAAAASSIEGPMKRQLPVKLDVQSESQENTASECSSRKELVKKPLPILLKKHSEGRCGAVAGGSGRKQLKCIEVSSAKKCVLPDCSSLIDKSLEWRSPAIFSQPQGYKFCLTVRGHKNDEGLEYLALGISRERGEFDHKLKWPVWFNVHLDIVNRGGHNIRHSTGINKLDSSSQVMVPLDFVLSSSKCNVYVEYNRVMDFVVDNRLEFRVWFERWGVEGGSDLQRSKSKA